MAELFGIADHINGRDPTLVNFHCERLDCAIVMDEDKPRSPIEEHAMDCRNRLHPPLARDSREESNDLVAASNRMERGGSLASSVGVKDGVLGHGKQSTKADDVSTQYGMA